MKDLELRMYGLVLYNISDIQKGIQFGHAVVEYGQKYHESQTYQEWAERYKTFIILNGGTTNEGNESGLGIGTMQEHYRELTSNGIKVATFNEPDLNDALTAITFLVDEKVFNHEDYPRESEYFSDRFKSPEKHVNFAMTVNQGKFAKEYPEKYDEYIKLVGGEKNYWLKNYLRQFKLA